MSISATNAVWKLETIGGVAKLVLLALADYAGADGGCWPSIRTLTRKTGISERAIRDNIRILEDRKMVRTIFRTAENGRKTSSRYQVLVGAEERMTDEGGEGAADAPTQGRQVPGVGAAGSGTQGRQVPGVGAAGSGTYKNTESFNSESFKNEPGSVPRSKRSVVALFPVNGEMSPAMKVEFMTFYKPYPRKKNVGRAERAFVRARRRGVELATIMAGLTKAIESDDWAAVDKDGRSIIPYAESWLNARGWEDEYAPKVARGKAALQEFLQGGKS